MSSFVPVQQTATTMHPSLNPIPPLGDLKTRADTIFVRGNFELDDPNDYELMRPSLQLASKLIQEPALLAVWQTAFHGAGKRIEHVVYPPAAEGGDDNKKQEHWEYTNHSKQLTEWQIRELRWDFLKLAGRVKFRMYDEDSFEARNPQRAGGQMPIFVPRVKMEELRQVTAAHYSGVQGLFEYALAAWTLAVGLCHELMHSVHFHVHATAAWKHFCFPGLAVSEDGFDWENEIFGGRVASDVTAQGRVCAFVLPWPNPMAVEQYLRSRAKVAVRLEPLV